ncbi:MAG: DUF2931 family protein [Lepagella sp.]
MDLQISGNAQSSYPCDSVYGLLWIDDKKSYAIPKRVPYCGEWGDALTDVIFLDPIEYIPNRLSLLWLSLYEEKYYRIDELLDQSKISSAIGEYSEATHIVVGMAPFGLCALWVSGPLRSILINCYKGEEFKEDFSKLDVYSTGMTLREYCSELASGNNDLLRQKINHPDRQYNYFRSIMTQYQYRYNIMFGRWDNVEWKELREVTKRPLLISISDRRSDGTYYKIGDNQLSKYHKAGKPTRIELQWQVVRSVYIAYIWIDDELIKEIFERFYGTHLETKVDFMIRVDIDQHKYELALYRYGLKEPQVIPEDIYQVLVFKNKFEYYRSDNYNQRRGAWIW